MLISDVHFPATIQEILELLDGDPDMLLLAGGTCFIGKQSSRVIEFPKSVASISRIQELRRTLRTENFIEFGACTTLTGLLSLTKGSLPDPLPRLTASIANRGIRNIATLGGNLCDPEGFHDLWPVLACMDAQVELRSLSGSRWASVYHLKSEEGTPYFPRKTILARLRIPLYSSDFCFFRKFGSSPRPGSGACFVCLARTSGQKVEDFRLAISGAKAFRLPDYEQNIIGRRRRSGQKEAQALALPYIEGFSGENWFDRTVFASLVEECFGRLFE
ncbi:MAG TPA: FAD binding domain-containing protein [Rectinemataceae bacterium]